jgi:hypothetical protein
MNDHFANLEVKIVRFKSFYHEDLRLGSLLLSEKEEHSFLKHTTIVYFSKEHDFVLQYKCVQLSPRVILFLNEDNYLKIFSFPRTNVLNCPFRSKVPQLNAYHQNEYVQFPSLFMRYSGHSCCISFFTLCCILNSGTDRSPYSHLRCALLGVRANIQPKSSIPISEKVEISPKDFTLGVKAEREKKFQSAPGY